MYVILEYVHHGNLRKYLRKCRKEQKSADRKGSFVVDLSPDQLLNFALGVAKAMKHISDCGVSIKLQLLVDTIFLFSVWFEHTFKNGLFCCWIVLVWSLNSFQYDKGLYKHTLKYSDSVYPNLRNVYCMIQILDLLFILTISMCLNLVFACRVHVPIRNRNEARQGLNQ